MARTNGAQQLEAGLRSSDQNAKLQAVRELKNTVIGNKFKKQQYSYLVPALLELTGSSNDPELVVQAVSALGSLAYGVEDGVRAIVACDGITSIIAALCSSEERVVAAAARSLKLVYQSPLAPRSDLLQAAVLQRLVLLLQHAPRVYVAEAAANVLSHCCTGAYEADSVVAAGAVPPLIQLLSSQHTSCQEAAVECLAALTQHSQHACQLLLSQPGTSTPAQQQQPPGAVAQAQQQGASTPVASEGAVQQQEQLPAVVLQLMRLMRQYDSRLRFLCVRCIANLSRGGDAAKQQCMHHACTAAVPHLIRLLAAADSATNGAADSHGASAAAAAYRSFLGLAGDAGGDHTYLQFVPEVLAKLTADRPQLMQLAIELDAIKLLVKLLTSKAAAAAAAPTEASKDEQGNSHDATSAPGLHSSSSSKSTSKAKARAAAAAVANATAAKAAVQLRRGCLTALGVLAMEGDSARQKMLSGQGNKLVQHVVAALSDADTAVRAAAAMCLRALSRSVSLLRSGAIPVTAVAPLVALLQDSSNSEVQVAAASTACNLLLSFSTLRKPFIKAGVLPALTPLTSSMIPELRQHAVWALKNMAHDGEAEDQRALLADLSWQRLKGLLVEDDEPRVQEQAVGLLQNLCKGGGSIEQVITWSEGSLLPLLEQQLDPVTYASLAAADAEQQQQQHLKSQLVGVLYTIANVCSGHEAHQQAVMKSNLPALILQHLQRASKAATAQIVASQASASATDACSSSTASAAAAGLFHEVCLAGVWCVINLLWSGATASCTTTEGGSSSVEAAAAAAAGSSGAVAARVQALKQLGYEDALRNMLLHCTAASTAAAGGPNAAASGAGVVVPPPMPSEVFHQDLVERLQTALQQLGMK